MRIFFLKTKVMTKNLLELIAQSFKYNPSSTLSSICVVAIWSVWLCASIYFTIKDPFFAILSMMFSMVCLLLTIPFLLTEGLLSETKKIFYLFKYKRSVDFDIQRKLFHESSDSIRLYSASVGLIKKDTVYSYGPFIISDKIKIRTGKNHIGENNYNVFKLFYLKTYSTFAYENYSLSKLHAQAKSFGLVNYYKVPTKILLQIYKMENKLLTSYKIGLNIVKRLISLEEEIEKMNSLRKELDKSIVKDEANEFYKNNLKQRVEVVDQKIQYFIEERDRVKEELSKFKANIFEYEKIYFDIINQAHRIAFESSVDDKISYFNVSMKKNKDYFLSVESVSNDFMKVIDKYHAKYKTNEIFN